jgi:hypothetical protein
MTMLKWRAHLFYTNGRTQEFTLYAKDYVEAQDKVSVIFPNVPYSISLE